MGSLANQYISQSYTSLIHLGSDTTISSSYTDLQDGLGNSLKISVNAQGDISSSGNIYAANLTASVSDISSLNAFTASVAGTNAFTASIKNTNVFTASLAGTNTFTASIAGTNVFTASIAGTNAFTASAQNSLNSLNAATSSYITSAVTSSMAVSSSLYAVTASIAREVIVSAINANQSTLPVGTVVRISGANGDNPQFNTASYDTEVNSSNTLGVLANTAVSGQYGDVTVIGKLVGVNTQGMNAGDLLYLSSSGKFTNVQPQAPLQIVILGEVLRVQSNNGAIFVNVSNGWELNELHNVRITNPLQGDLLVYEATSSLWKNQPSSSFATSAITGSSLVTASFSGNTLTFTKGNGTTFGVVLPDVSGSTINTGSLVTTSSFNAYTSSTDGRLNSLELFTASVAGTNAFTQSADQRLDSIEAQSGSWVTSAITASSVVTASINNSTNTITFTKGDGATFDIIVQTGSISSIDTGSFATTGSNTFIGNQTITSNTNIDFTLQSTAVSGQTNVILDAFQNNVTTKGNISFTNNGQFGGSGSIKFVSSLNNIEFASDAGTRVGATNGGGNGISAQAISFQVQSGSLSLAPSGVTNATASLSHISSSSGTQFVNLMFKNNTNNATTVISGSNNIFTNPSAPTAGFIRHIGGSNNLMLNSGSVPQISGSMLTSPSLMGNILSHASANPITLRGPVSASAYSINQNILMGGQINYGSSAANSFDKATAGMSTTGNALFNGTINVNAPTTPLSSSVSISGNLLFGASVTLNCFSSSIGYASNIQNGGITVNNSFVAAAGSSAAVLSARANVNTIYGVGHALNISGTNTSTTQGKQFYANLLAGTFISSSMPTGDNCNIVATAVIGNSLIITGSTLTSTFAGGDTANTGQGSLFAGRFNDISGTKDLTGETVFAIGTGTSNTNRKTGFLIDSGSNTFVEGTLSVSGSSTFNGNSLITGSLTVSGSATITGSVSVSNVLSLAQLDPLPAGADGQLAVSASNLYFFSGSAWNKIAFA